MSDLEADAADVIDVALRLNRALGPGLLESVYETVLAAKLTQLGHLADRQVPISFSFEQLRFENAFRIDLRVNKRLVVEIKSLEQLSAVHGKQLLIYLRLCEQPLGLLINFGGATLKGSIRRVVNRYTPLAPSRLRVNQPSSGE